MKVLNGLMQLLIIGIILAAIYYWLNKTYGENNAYYDAKAFWIDLQYKLGFKKAK